MADPDGHLGSGDGGGAHRAGRAGTAQTARRRVDRRRIPDWVDHLAPGPRNHIFRAFCDCRLDTAVGWIRFSCPAALRRPQLLARAGGAPVSRLLFPAVLSTPMTKRDQLLQPSESVSYTHLRAHETPEQL